MAFCQNGSTLLCEEKNRQTSIGKGGFWTTATLLLGKILRLKKPSNPTYKIKNISLLITLTLASNPYNRKYNQKWNRKWKPEVGPEVVISNEIKGVPEISAATGSDWIGLFGVHWLVRICSVLILPLDENCKPEVGPGLSKGIKDAGFLQNSPFGKSLLWLKYYALCD